MDTVDRDEKLEQLTALVRELWSNATVDDDNHMTRELNFALKAARRVRYMEEAKDFRPGQKVSFTSRSGEVVVGTIQRVNAKSVTVMTGYTKWRVAPGKLNHEVGA